MRRRIQAEQSLAGYTRRHQAVTVTAALGTNTGVVDHPTRGSNWVYARLKGDQNQIVVALEESGVSHTADLLVELELVKKTAGSYYRVRGLATSVVYPSNPYGTPQAHGSTHERMDGATGGNDPVDVYARMVVPLRAVPQATPDDTLYVNAGYNPLTGNFFAGGSSTAVTFPASLARIDFLYLGTDDALHWVTGTPAASPAFPAIPVPSVPLAFVFLSVGQTAISEMHITRDPGILRSAVGAAPLAGADSTAIHDNVASEIHAITNKATPVDADELVIEDSADSWNKKRISIGALMSSVGELLVDDNVATLTDDTPDVLYQ